MNFTPEQIEEIENLAGIGYSVRQLAMYFNLPPDELLSEYYDESSTFRYHYDRGTLLTMALMDSANVKLAIGGNQTAYLAVQKKLKETKYQQIKKNIFNGLG